MLQSLKHFFLPSKAFSVSRTSGQVRPHHNLSQKAIPHLFHLEELKGLDLYETSVEEIQQYLSDGWFTSVDYVKFCLLRIHSVNPYLECVIEVNPDAIEIAVELDEERRQVGDAFHPDWGMKGVTWKRVHPVDFSRGTKPKSCYRANIGVFYMGYQY